MVELEEVYNVSSSPSVRSIYLTRAAVASLSESRVGNLNEATSRLGPISKITTTAGKEIYVLGTAAQVRERIFGTGKGLLNG